MEKNDLTQHRAVQNSARTEVPEVITIAKISRTVAGYRTAQSLELPSCASSVRVGAGRTHQSEREEVRGME